MSKEKQQTSGEFIQIEVEKLKLIAEYYDFPLAAFFMSTGELKELKAREREVRRKETTRKLKLLKEIIGVMMTNDKDENSR